MQKLAYFRKGRRMISQLVVLYNVLYGFGNKNKEKEWEDTELLPSTICFTQGKAKTTGSIPFWLLRKKNNNKNLN